jgi:hypothetical protein
LDNVTDETLKNYLVNTLGQSSVGNSIKIVDTADKADLQIDLAELKDKNQIAMAQEVFITEIKNVLFKLNNPNAKPIKTTDMNWKDIHKNYPLAFKVMIYPVLPPKLKEIYNSCSVLKNDNGAIIFGNVLMKLFIPMPYHRILYDAFDQNLIFVNASYGAANVFLISKEGKVLEQYELKDNQNRLESEFAGFYKAFEILERQIHSANKDVNNLSVVK